MEGTVIVADDDKTIRTVLTQALTRAGCKVRATGSVSTLWKWVDEGAGDVVVSDVNFPDGDGLEILPNIKKRRADLPVIMISAQNTVLTAIRASELGAYDYLPKPFDLRELLSKVSKALQGVKTGAAVTDSNQGEDLPMVGSSPQMQEIYRLLARVINTDLAVMISGESGTGKDLFAHSLHSLGHRGGNDFAVINSATTNAQQLANILLPEKDVVDPNTAKKGSTVYFDDISELDENSQQGLLNILKDERLRGQDYRFISSTQKTLDEMVNQGSFREDLFYRLNVVPVIMPAIRERPQDIAELVQHFLVQAAANGLPTKAITAKALDLMKTQQWFGNVRELENFTNRLVIMSSEDEIGEKLVRSNLAEMPKPDSSASVHAEIKLSQAVEGHLMRYFDLHGEALPPSGLYGRIMREVELPLIALCLSATRGNQIKTAELLGINRNTLRKKIAELEIQVTRSKKMM